MAVCRHILGYILCCDRSTATTGYLYSSWTFFLCIVCTWCYFYALCWLALLWFGRETCTSQCHFQLSRWLLLIRVAWHLRNSSFLSQNSKLMHWWNGCVLCVGLKLILLHACRIDFTQLFFDDWAEVTLHTPCTLFHVHYIGCNSLCQKIHVLHAPAWLLSACHAIFTWLQNLVEPLRSMCTFWLFNSGLFDELNFNHIGWNPSSLLGC